MVLLPPPALQQQRHRPGRSIHSPTVKPHQGKDMRTASFGATRETAGTPKAASKAKPITTCTHASPSPSSPGAPKPSRPPEADTASDAARCSWIDLKKPVDSSRQQTNVVSVARAHGPGMRGTAGERADSKRVATRYDGRHLCVARQGEDEPVMAGTMCLLMLMLRPAKRRHSQQRHTANSGERMG